MISHHAKKSRPGCGHVTGIKTPRDAELIFCERRRYALHLFICIKRRWTSRVFIVSIFLIFRLVTLAVFLPAFCLKVFRLDAEAQQEADERNASKHTKC